MTNSTPQSLSVIEGGKKKNDLASSLKSVGLGVLASALVAGLVSPRHAGRLILISVAGGICYALGLWMIKK